MAHIQNLKRNDTDELTYKTEKDSQTKNELMIAGGKDRGKDSQEVWDGHVHTITF